MPRRADSPGERDAERPPGKGKDAESGTPARYSAESLMVQEMPEVASARMQRLPPYLFGRINALKLRLRKEGVDVIDLGMGNPNDPTPKPVVDKLCEAVQDKRNQRYSVSIGLFNLRREVAR
ncbi:MAG: aminotransferase class I/II-fold pyridoxal phosphate-dependent enzyme, partial [Planctomycetota bacterium]